jgi:hypothetical protein
MTHSWDAAIDAVVGAIEATADPVQRFREVPELEAKFEDAMRDVRKRIANELHADKSWREVGEILGLSTQRVWQISRGER